MNFRPWTCSINQSFILKPYGWQSMMLGMLLFGLDIRKFAQIILKLWCRLSDYDYAVMVSLYPQVPFQSFSKSALKCIVLSSGHLSTVKGSDQPFFVPSYPFPVKSPSLKRAWPTYYNLYQNFVWSSLWIICMKFRNVGDPIITDDISPSLVLLSSLVCRNRS